MGCSLGKKGQSEKVSSIKFLLLFEKIDIFNRIFTSLLHNRLPVIKRAHIVENVTNFSSWQESKNNFLSIQAD